MNSIKIENIPDNLLKKLKASAAFNHTSIEREILLCIEKVFMEDRKKNMAETEKAALVIDQLGLSYRACDLKKYMENCC
ncbi:MAG: hypothetical protein AB7E04_14235 [Desulfobacteraceae bacterium]|jgi:plasmid stability protein